jgi:phosphoglucosamine mutase
MATPKSTGRDGEGPSFRQVAHSITRRVEFGADGIRGVANQWPLVHPVLVHIGTALGHFLLRRAQHPQVVIGRDTRLSGEQILHCLVAGLTGAGVQTIDLGIITTPGVAFLVREQGMDLGVIVSASHNPYDHNGIKLIGPNGLRLQREEELEVEQLIRSALANGIPPLENVGQASNGSHLLEIYTQDHVRFVQSYWRDSTPLRSLRLVLDCANGAASAVAPAAFRQLGAEVIEVNSQADGANINLRCGSEHLRSNPQDLFAHMHAAGARHGFAFDGDGDRLAVLDDTGRVYDGSSLLYILAAFFQQRQELRHNTVVTTEVTNRGVITAFERRGITATLVGRGDRNIEAAIWESDFLLGGEDGGNIVINDGRHTAADAVFTALTLAGIIANWRDLNEFMADVTLLPQIQRSIFIRRQLALDERRHVQAALNATQEAISFGGRVLWWQATTEPGVLRLLVEADATSHLHKLDVVFDAFAAAVRGLPFLADENQATSARRNTQGMDSGRELQRKRQEVDMAPQLQVDPQTGLVHLGEADITVRLSKQLHRVLLCLWQQRHRPVRKDELIGFAWPEVDLAEGVTDETVAQAISRLARLLRNQSGGVQYIESIRGVGGWRLHAGGLPMEQPSEKQGGDAPDG